MKFDMTCTYCGYKWDVIATPANVGNKSCPKCKDTKIIVKEWNRSKIDYYAGAPEFVEPEESEPEQASPSSNPFFGYDYGFTD